MKWLILLLLLSATVARADVPSRESAFAAKNAGDYDKAAQLFTELLQRDKNDAELWFHYGLVLRFAGALEEAVAAQKTAQNLAPHDLDIQLEIARLNYYRGDISAAREQLQSVSTQAPDYPGVAELQRQLESAGAKASVDKPWWLTLGHEWSRLERGDRWQMNLLHLNRTLSADMSAQLQLEHAERYDDADYYAALSGFYRLTSRVNLAAGIGAGIEADYLPNTRVWLYGDWLALRSVKRNTGLRLTLDLNHNRYSELQVNVAKPGVRMEFADHLEWSLQSILVDSSGGSSQSGWATRVAWSWRQPDVRLDAGYSSAPESEESVTLDTRGYFVGARWQFSRSTAAALSLAREERESVPFRDIVNLSVIIRY